MVAMSCERNIAEANRQLSDTDVYQQVSSTVVFGVIEEVRIFCLVFKRLASSPRICLLMLFQLIQSRLAGRPIVSAVGSPTEGLSELVDHFIQPFVSNIPSYIRDTQDFLDKLHVHCPLPVESILCTIDATALYPSIPHDDRLANLCNAL